MDLKETWARQHREDITLGRRFAITRCGFIGLVPSHALVGDKVFAFEKGPVLYVARKSMISWVSEAKQYIYVGESYFHGLMDGGWRERDSFAGPSEVILV